MEVSGGGGVKPIHFKQSNSIYAKDQKEYIPLPTHKDSEGIVTSCYHFSFWERVKVLCFGRIYLQVMTFNCLLQPQKLTVGNPLIMKKQERGKSDTTKD